MRRVPCRLLGNTGPSLMPARVYAGRQDGGQGSPCPTRCWPRRPRGFALKNLGSPRQPPSHAWKAELSGRCWRSPTGGLSGQQPSHSRLFRADCARPQKAPGTRRVSATDLLTRRPVDAAAVRPPVTNPLRGRWAQKSWPPRISAGALLRRVLASGFSSTEETQLRLPALEHTEVFCPATLRFT